MPRFRLMASILLGLLPLMAGGCTNPSRAQMVQAATFENKVLADAENRLMDAFDAKLLDPQLHAQLTPSIKAARAAANEMTRVANTPGATRSAFDIALDQFAAALGPIMDANAQADAASMRTTATTRASLRLSAPPPTARPPGHVPPSVANPGDASRFNAPPGR